MQIQPVRTCAHARVPSDFLKMAEGVIGNTFKECGNITYAHEGNAMEDFITVTYTHEKRYL